MYPAKATIVEVGPRDGLQSEETVLSTDAKVALINALSTSGLTHIEATAFVNPTKIPQLADAEEVCTRITRAPGVTYSALVPNAKGYARAIGVGLREIAVFTAATDSYNERNIGTTIEGAFERYKEVLENAAVDGVRARGYVSVAFGCPYEGDVPVERVVEVSRRLLDMGCYQISLGDTTGLGNPVLVDETIVALGKAGIGPERVALHLHDTRGTGLANALAGLQAGVTTFDASLGGLGGSPFAKGAAGNLATEELVYMLESMGVVTGVNLDALVVAAEGVARALAKDLPSRYLRAARGDKARA